MGIIRYQVLKILTQLYHMYIGGRQLESLALGHINQPIRLALGPVDVGQLVPVN